MTEESFRETAPQPGVRHLIDKPEELSEVAKVLANASVMGIDVEAGIPPRERQSRFALLQIAIPGETYAIDPLRIRDLAALAPILASEHILKVFHGIALDRDMLESSGLDLRYVADLSEVARSAYGKGEASLAAFTRRAFGIGMDKSLQRSDWLHRPIELPLLAYAWRDAELTLGLYFWCTRHEPDLLKLHTTLSPRPEVPVGLPVWLQAVLSGSRQPVHDLLATDSLDLERDTDSVLVAVRAALAHVRAPHLRGRVIRSIGELELFEMAPDLIELLHSRSANERAAAARALATMGEASAEEYIAQLKDDPTDEVRQAAEQALRMLPERILAESSSGATMNPIVGDHP
ncbi:MAG: ribonuclease [Chloroflexi bacterium]|nr:ribonuclease [Chloroflexota bacterium]